MTATAACQCAHNAQSCTVMTCPFRFTESAEISGINPQAQVLCDEDGNTLLYFEKTVFVYQHSNLEAVRIVLALVMHAACQCLHPMRLQLRSCSASQLPPDWDVHR